MSLHNVGIIRNSDVKLDGLTVITGKNSSGKTTVGKVVYSLLAAGSNPVESFEETRRSYICGQLREVENTLRLRRAWQMHQHDKYTMGKHEGLIRELTLHRFLRYGINELMDFLIATRCFVEELSLEAYMDYFTSTDKAGSTVPKSFLETLSDGFYERKERALSICFSAIELVNDDGAFLRFLRDRTTAYLNHEFNKQIRPVRARGSVARITLVDQGKNVVSCKVRSKNSVEYLKDSTFLYPYEKCIFIDNPFVIDQLDDYDNYDEYASYRTINDGASKALITSEDIESHDDVVIRLLMQGEKKNFFSDLEIQKKYGPVFEKINAIVPGEFAITSDGVFYVQEGARLSVKNLATGSKMFFIIKKLLLNGLLDDTTMLVLDEPESHLHPEWINKFAEILVVLINDVKLNVLLTTHSPNLMLALNVYAQKAGIAQDSHFYLAEKMEGSDYSQIRCIDDCIGEGYSHLSLPLVEMNLQLDALITEG